MSGIIKNAFRLPVLKTATSFLRPSVCINNCKTQNVRSLWHMSSLKNRLHQNPTSHCKCGCGIAGVHTKGALLQTKSSAADYAGPSCAGEKELAEFLNEEITAEKKLQKTKTIPSELDGFAIKIDGSEILLRKSKDNEIVEISFNVNHTVDTDTEPEVDPSMDKPEVGEMRSKPTFEVEIKRGGKTLGFTCSMISPTSQPTDEAYNDLFAIDEVVMYEGEWNENNYSVSGEVLDGTLYDLMMNLLEDKGISNEFVEKLSDFSTAYEHSCYINMLENIQKFSLGK